MSPEICSRIEKLQTVKLIHQSELGAYDISVVALYNHLDKGGLK